MDKNLSKNYAPTSLTDTYSPSLPKDFPKERIPSIYFKYKR